MKNEMTILLNLDDNTLKQLLNVTDPVKYKESLAINKGIVNCKMYKPVQKLIKLPNYDSFNITATQLFLYIGVDEHDVITITDENGDPKDITVFKRVNRLVKTIDIEELI